MRSSFGAATIAALICIFLYHPLRAQPSAKYCDVPVVVESGVGRPGSLLDADGNAVIVIEPRDLDQFSDPFIRWVLAHECGHMVMSHHYLIKKMARLGPRRGVEMRVAVGPAMELEASCWAAEQLALDGDTAAIRAAIEFHRYEIGSSHGPEEPSGFETAREIERCSDLE